MDPSPATVIPISTLNPVTFTALIASIILLLLFSAFFSAAEGAYLSSNRIRLKNMENNGSKTARKVLKQLDNFEKLINTILIGNNIVNITAASLAALVFSDIIKNQSIATLVSTASVTVVVLMFCEIMPKTLAKDSPEKVALFVQPVMSFLQIVLTPFIWLFGLWRKIYKPKKIAGITDDELITIIEEAENEGEIDVHESRLIRSAIEFDDVEVYDIMVPRVNVIAVEDTDSIQTIKETFAEHGFSRLPVYHGSLDVIAGILLEKDFYSLLSSGGQNVMDIVKNNICLSRNTKISVALRALQKAKTHMAVVVDEFGGTNGIVTMEDILEELVGEIYDEHDEVEVLTKKVDDNTYIIQGAENLEDMFEQIGFELKEEFESASVGGWVTEEMEKIPAAGESFSYKNIDFTVVKANNRKVIEIKAVVNEVNDESEEEE